MSRRHGGVSGASTATSSGRRPKRHPAAEAGEDDALDADIAFHVAILRAARNPFYAQFEPVVATALRTSIRFTNKVKGRSANIPEHAAVADAIERRDIDGARGAMRRIVGDVLDLINDTTG